MIKQEKSKSLLLALGFIIAFVVIFIVLAQFKSLIPIKFERYTHGFIGLIAGLITVWLFLKFEKSNFTSIGLFRQKSTFKKFGLGTLAGLLMSALMIFSQIFYSDLEVTLNEDYDVVGFLFWSSALIPLALMEEIGFRSYPFLKLNNAFGIWTAQIIIAIAFAVYHIANGWALGTSFLGPGVWAFAYGLAAMVSDGISMPTGLHYGVNVFLAAIGGQANIQGIWTIDFSGPVSEEVIQANQSFGIVLQLTLLILCILGTILFIKYRKNVNQVYL